MFSFLIGIIGSALSLIGWFAFHSVVLLLIGTGLSIIETIIEWKQLNANAKKLEIGVFIVGSVIALAFTSVPWYIGGMLAIAIYGGAAAIIGLFSIIRFFL